MKRRGAVLLFAVVAALGLYTAPAGAVGPRGGHVIVVDDDANGGCHGRDANFQTIQDAIDHPDTKDGDTILVCPGLYTETVTVIKRGLILKGANAGRDATRGRRGPESIVTHVDPKGTVQLLQDDITWDGFTIRGIPFDNNGPIDNGPGMYTSPDASGYVIRDTIFEENGMGLHLGSDGSRPTIICRNRFIANNEFEGPGGANGIYSDEGAEQVLISSNRFERHNGAGIFFADQDPDREPPILQQDVLVERNRSIDDKTFASFFASSRVRLTDNSVRARVNDDAFPDATSAIYIGARNRDVKVDRNRVWSASGSGIHVTDSGELGREDGAPTNVVVRKNKVQHAEEFGIEVSASGKGQYRVIGNRALYNGVGIHLGLDTDDVLVGSNRARDNGLDCQDVSKGHNAADGTAGTRNIWQNNAGTTADPEGICTPPPPKHYRPGHPGNGHHHPHHPDPCRCNSLPWQF